MEQWKNVIWTDETSVHLGRTTIGQRGSLLSSSRGRLISAVRGNDLLVCQLSGSIQLKTVHIYGRRGRKALIGGDISRLYSNHP
jgi:hypothetical protein